MMKKYFLFCHFQLNIQFQQLSPNSFLDHTTRCNYKAAFPSELLNAVWKDDMREIPNVTFLFNYSIILLDASTKIWSAGAGSHHSPLM